MADIFMIVLGLFGALSNYGYRWGWFGIGCLFQIFIVLGLVLTGALKFHIQHALRFFSREPSRYFALQLLAKSGTRYT